MNLSRALLAGAVLLAGCGQKGPLYLPDTTQGEVVTRPAPMPGATPTAPGTPTAPASPVTDDTHDKKTGATPPPPGK